MSKKTDSIKCELGNVAHDMGLIAEEINQGNIKDAKQLVKENIERLEEILKSI